MRSLAHNGLSFTELEKKNSEMTKGQTKNEERRDHDQKNRNEQQTTAHFKHEENFGAT